MVLQTNRRRDFFHASESYIPVIHSERFPCMYSCSRCRAYGVMIFLRLINHLIVNKGIEYVAVNPALKHQVGEDPPHIAVGLREHERLLWFLFHRR